MKKENRKYLYGAISLLALFLAWTLAVCFADVKEIGPENSAVGFSQLNGFFHSLTGVNMNFYLITDWLSLVPVGVIFGFGLLGLCQWIKRKKFVKVDLSILVLGGFYVTVMLAYLLFEELAINYRPVLINGVLEASYPSSTTLLTICVMITALMQFNSRIKKKVLRLVVAALIIAFTAFMVVLRLLSGVHWLTDIIGGVLLSVGLIMLYCFFVKIER